MRLSEICGKIMKLMISDVARGEVLKFVVNGKFSDENFKEILMKMKI